MPTKTLRLRARRLARLRPTSRTRTRLKVIALLLLVCASATVRAQTAKLPTPDKIIGDYVKAVGGKKRLAALRDATYEWSVRRNGADAGTARTQVKTTGALRKVKKIGNAQLFAPAIDQSEHRSGLVRDLLDLFGGSPRLLVSNLLETGAITLKDLKALQSAAEGGKNRRSRGGHGRA